MEPLIRLAAYGLFCVLVYLGVQVVLGGPTQVLFEATSRLPFGLW